MIDWSLEGDNRSLEGEILQLELNLELPTLERSLLRSSHEYNPPGIVLLEDLVTPT